MVEGGGEQPLGFGDEYQGVNIALTVESYRDNVADGEYRALKVRACVKEDAPNGADGIAYVWDSWALYDADDGRYKPTSSYDPDAISPLFPRSEDDGIYYAGDCVTGWILFEPAEAEPVRAAFTSMGGPTQYTVDWELR